MDNLDYYKGDILIKGRKEKNMKIFRKILGVLVIIGGILLGLYVGLWQLHALGYSQMAEALANQDTIGVAIGSIRVWSSWLGFVIAYVIGLIGRAIYE